MRFILALTVLVVLLVPAGLYSEELSPEIKANLAKMNKNVTDNIAVSGKVLYRKLNVYWTDTPPTLDGRMDEECWRNAEVAEDFYLHASILLKGLKRPANQTEVRVCYDSEALYVFYKMFDNSMSELVLGQPQDYRDILNVHADQIELFLDPNLGNNRPDREQDNMYYQMCVNPHGTTYDSRGYSGLAWNPDWHPRTRVTEKYWTVEARIPFRELAFPNRWLATPRNGDVWGVLFARDQGSLKEWSRWTSSGMGRPGFHPVKNFGRLVFAGRRDGLPFASAKIKDFKPIFFGKNSLQFALAHKVDGGLLRLTRDGKVVEERKLKPEKEIKLTYNVPAGGKWSAEFTLRADGKEVYRYYTARRLFRAFALLGEIERKTAKALARLDTIKHPNASALRKRCNELSGRARAVLKDSKSGRITEDKIPELRELQAAWKKFKFEIFRIDAYPSGKTDSPFTAIAVRPTTKVFRHRGVKNEFAKGVELRAAGTDRESFQLAVVPFWNDLKDLKVTVGPLKSEAGEIPASEIKWFTVDYVKVAENHLKALPGYDPDDPDALRWWPDVLLPGKAKLDAPNDRITTLWFDVHCPQGTSAGRYVGGVTLAANGHSVRVPLALTAHGFDIPKHPSLMQNHWLHYLYFSRFYGKLDFYKSNDAFLAQYEKHLQFLERYRGATYPFGRLNWRFVKAYLEPDGRYTFDFTDLKRIIRLGQKYGANFFGSSFGCNPGGVVPIISGVYKVTDRRTGKMIPLKDCPNMKDLWKERSQLQPLEDVLFSSPFYSDYLKQLVSFMKRIGILDESYYELFDESKPNVIIKAHTPLRKIVPDLPLMDYGPYPTQSYMKLKPAGYEDIWVPGLNDRIFSGENFKALKERRIKYGERYGFYTCGNMPRPDGRFRPFTKVYQSYVAPRIIPWFAWKYRVDTFLVFMFFSGMPEKGWPKVPAVTDPAGYTTLIYPGDDYEFIPSIRLACLRDGMEDYEYFRVLHKLSAYLDPDYGPHAKRLKEVDKELAIEEDICAKPTQWTRDVRLLEEKRSRVVALIKAVKKDIADYKSRALRH